MYSLDTIKAPVAEQMKNFESFFAESMKSNIPLLNIITNYIYRRKGKQMRPLLVFLSARLHGEPVNSSYTAATFIELLHTASLVHDDVVDEAYERRGFLSINALWRSKIAVLVGDYLLSKGLILATERNELELLNIMSMAVREMSEGELLQLEKSRKLNIDEDTYYEVIRKKTAALIAACAASGAKSVKAPQDVVDTMWKFGETLGIAFQIRDDIMDYETHNFIGKPTGNDLKEKKITLPLIYVLKNADKKTKSELLRKIRAHHDERSVVEEIIIYVRDKGGVTYAEEKMLEFKQKAIGLIMPFPENDAKKSLLDFVDYTISRKL